MNKIRIKPVLLGADVGIYSIARSFYEEYEVISKIFCKDVLWTINHSKILEYEILDNYNEVIIDKLIEYGKKNKKVKLILLTTIEKYVDLIVTNKSKLEKYYIIPYVDKKILDRIDYKQEFYNILEELDINHPKTIIANKENYQNLEINFDYPIVCKTNNTAKYSQISFPLKKKVFIVENREELDEILTQVYETTDYNDGFCIQEFIPGDDSCMRVLTCYCDKNHEVVFSALGQPLLEENAPGAIGNYSVIINRENKDILDDAKKFLKHVKYIGFANFDIKYNSETGKYNFFEINVRLGRSNYYLTGSGYNYTKYLVDEYVYNKKFDSEVIATNKILYSIVPFYIIKKYVKDKKLVEEAKNLKKNKKCIDPTYSKKDSTLKRWFYIKLARINQIRKYKKYYNK